jgi:hypothetical protein
LQSRDKLLATAPGGTEKEKGEDAMVKMMEMIGSNIATEAHGFSAWRDKEEMEEFDKWEPVEKLEPVKMAQNTKKKHAAMPGGDGSQKTAPVVSSGKIDTKGPGGDCVSSGSDYGSDYDETEPEPSLRTV